MVEWDSHAELILRDYYEYSVTSTWTHNRTASRFEDQEVCFALPRIVLSGVVSSGALALEYIQSKDIKSYCLLALAAIGAINGLVGSVQLYFNYGKLSGMHRASAAAYFELSSRVDLMLKKRKRDRVDAGNFLDAVQADFQRLTESAPVIPSAVVRAFKRENNEWILSGAGVQYTLNGLKTLVIAEESDEDNKSTGEVELAPTTVDDPLLQRDPTALQL